ncbi:Potassium-transporting ATPase C chain [Paramagnetospirillum magnetotacticum MS-1]|uniref:Potassium-transporting ATPase KdpC subunit n=1 Tax=Paramagnetospirillum magnetotacticum MS-1 TaxID=272627 RepID=A0A0C2YW54_PARME|nr:potassium-transporting ATPase subunit KdpC [Paramagnetospirillum magnetotacticum]KIL99348.1 Potassium-transporting ATPase C chain [Paramagnetospirillum magnetotacticum MS-1]
MWKDLRSSAFLLLALTAITGLAYPAAVTGMVRAAFPWQAEGSLIEKNGRVIGSELIGQSFSLAGYFWGRPSATTTADPADSTKTIAQPYNAANSGASNLAPSSKALNEAVAERKIALQSAHPGQTDPVPADLLTSSASGLDPHISPAAAAWQIKRVAAARGASADELRKLVASLTEGRDWGVLGEPRINLLRLNMALDERWPMK